MVYRGNIRSFMTWLMIKYNMDMDGQLNVLNWDTKATNKHIFGHSWGVVLKNHFFAAD
jgi:hypothetical protein